MKSVLYGTLKRIYTRGWAVSLRFVHKLLVNFAFSQIRFHLYVHMQTNSSTDNLNTQQFYNMLNIYTLQRNFTNPKYCFPIHYQPRIFMQFCSPGSITCPICATRPSVSDEWSPLTNDIPCNHSFCFKYLTLLKSIGNKKASTL